MMVACREALESGSLSFILIFKKVKSASPPPLAVEVVGASPARLWELSPLSPVEFYATSALRLLFQKFFSFTHVIPTLKDVKPFFLDRALRMVLLSLCSQSFSGVRAPFLRLSAA